MTRIYIFQGKKHKKNPLATFIARGSYTRISYFNTLFNKKYAIFCSSFCNV